MLFYLMRHGDAVAAYEDPQRPLSAHGRAQADAVGGRFAARAPARLVVLHSTKLRARQTAERVCARALPEVPPQEVDGLLPSDPVDPWVARLEDLEASALLVGHNPFMSDLASRLLGQGVGFGTAAMACLRRHGPGRWTLEWLDEGHA